MIKNINHIIKIFIISFFLSSSANSNEQFNFDINNIEILNQGNFFKGTAGGIVSTNDGLTIEAKTFEYDKIKNILYAYENVEIIDKLNNYKIYTNKIIYLKNEEKIFTEGNSKAYNNDGIIINADKFEYDKFLNILNAKKKVSVFDEIKNYKIFSENITYFKNQQKFYSSGNTSAIIKSKYEFNSTDVNFLRNEMELSSIHKSTIKNIKDKSFYEFENFNYLINKNILKAKNIMVITNSEVPISQSDKYFFNDGIFDIEKKNFTASQTRVHLEKNIFDRKENDPRLIGVSSKKENDITIVNKGLFTSCKKNEKCPPWHITAKKIKHNKKTKQIIYDNAVLKVYDIPVLYYPKFFHPDPTVERQSGFLRPQLNSSNILGSSASIPYFKVLAENKDLTFMPTFFDSKTLKIENEYRQENENSSLIVNYGHVNNYNSPLQNNKNSINHLFGKYSKNLYLENFNESDLDISVQKITNDTYLKVFDKYIPDSILKPQNQDTLASKIQINLTHSDYTFFTGADAYENLSGKNSDRYTYVLPYYKFSKNLNYDFIEGYLNFSSSGNNTLKNTNTLSTRVINNLKYNSEDHFSNQGFKTNFNLYLKNLNTVANNDATYKSSPQAQLDSIFEIRSELPLINNSDIYLNTLIPKVSFRINV